MNDKYKQMSWEEIYEFNKKLDNMEHDYKNKCEQLEAYENMRKEAIEYIENYYIFDDENREYYQTHNFDKSNAKKLHDILNKVGDKNE